MSSREGNMIPGEIQGAKEMRLFDPAGSGEVDQGRGRTEWGKYRQDASPPSVSHAAFLPHER